MVFYSISQFCAFEKADFEIYNDFGSKAQSSQGFALF